MAELVAEELAIAHHDTGQANDRHLGVALAVAHNPTARFTRVVLCFPTGPVGEELSKLHAPKQLY